MVWARDLDPAGGYSQISGAPKVLPRSKPGFPGLDTTSFPNPVCGLGKSLSPSPDEQGMAGHGGLRTVKRTEPSILNVTVTRFLILTNSKGVGGSSTFFHAARIVSEMQTTGQGLEPL